MRLVGGLHAHLTGRASHAALFYSSEREYVEGVRRFLAPAVDIGAPVLIVAPRPSLERLKSGLNGAGGRAELLDMAELGVNPARIIPVIDAAIDAHPDERLYFVGELDWAGRGREEITEATRHEALVNRAFRRRRVEILCPYDVNAAGAEIVANAELTHPLVCHGHRRAASAVYAGRRLPASCEAPLPAPPGRAKSLRFELGDLARVRALVSEEAGRRGAPHRALRRDGARGGRAGHQQHPTWRRERDRARMARRGPPDLRGERRGTHQGPARRPHATAAALP